MPRKMVVSKDGIYEVEMTPDEIVTSNAPVVYEISKVEIIRRMTTAEATSAELLIASANAKFRLMWSSANIIRSDDEWFPILQAALAGAFGEERAAQLLAPVA